MKFAKLVLGILIVLALTTSSAWSKPPKERSAAEKTSRSPKLHYDSDGVLEPGEAAGENLHGPVDTRPCPWDCKMAGLPRHLCRNWHEGKTCHVEDLSRYAKQQPAPPPQTNVPTQPIWKPLPQPSLISRAPFDPAQTSGSGYQECQQMRSGYVPSPRISIYKVKPTGNVFSSKYKIVGEIEGICLVEAGLYEDGRRVQNIPLRTTPEFQRFEFEVKGSPDNDPEVRVYNIQGDRDIFEVREPNDYDRDDNYRRRDRDNYYDRHDRDYDRRDPYDNYPYRR